MRCKQARKEIGEMGRPIVARPALANHVAGCDGCRVSFDERRALDAVFLKLRAETDVIGPSERVEQRVLAELNGVGVAGRPASTVRAWRWLGAGAVVCAAVLLAVTLMTHGGGKRGTVVQPQAVAALVEEPFTAMPYVVPPAPYERTTVVRTEVPLQTMVAAGFKVHGDVPGSSMPADVLYGEDGRILAVRLISQPNDSSKRMD